MTELTESRGDELRALSHLGFGELGSAARGIGQVHEAIAGRVFRAVGSQGRVVEAAHTAITNGVYGALRGATAALGRAADSAIATRRAPAAPALSTTPRGAAALGALNGLIGDELEREGSALRQPMSLRVRGEVVTPEREALAAAFPAATPRLAVFVHGLMETEFGWHWGGGPTYGARLAEDLGFTAVHVRYNTGRHVSENGRSLAELMEALVDAWPVEVDRLALVGHSMGGLVARSACYCADLEGAAWVRKVRHVVSLGTPHMGAPLEQAVHVASAALNALPETRPFGSFLRRRSAGIRDPRQSSSTSEPWRRSRMPELRRRRKPANGRVSGSAPSAALAMCTACSSGAPMCGVPTVTT